MRCGISLALGLMLAFCLWAAAPPTLPRALTAQEEKELAALYARRDRHDEAREFEQSAKVAQQIAQYRRERQGAGHWQASDARFDVDYWRRLAAVPAKDRAEVVRAVKLNDEGVALLNRGHYRKSEKPLRQALQISEKVLGLDHADTASSYNNLAGCLLGQGKPAEALPLFRKALEISEKVLGLDHPDTANSYNNVAGCLDNQGKHAEALPLYRKALQICEKVLGLDHPRTALSYINVAGCLNAQGKHSEALPLFRQALQIIEKGLGLEHPDTATSYSNVASCLQDLGKPAEALPLYRQALQIREKVLGEDHADTANSYNNVAFCLNAQGKHAEALPLYRQALQICEKVHGLDHPHTASSYNNLASCLNDQGKPAEALPLCRKALQIREKVLGLDHPSTATSYNNVAYCLDNQGKHSEALPLFRKALVIREKVLGLDHPDTATSYNNLAFCLNALGKHSEALPLYRQALQIHKEVLGPDHPHTAAGYNNLAFCLWQQERRNESVRLWQQSQHGQESARVLRADSGFDRAQGDTRRISVQSALAVGLANLKQPRNAFRHAEASLARGLLDDLSPLTSAEVARAEQLRWRLTKLDPLLASFSGRARLSDEQKAQQETLKQEYRRLTLQWSDLFTSASARAVLSLERIQQSIPDDSALVLWIEELGTRWACVLRSQGKPLWTHLPGGKDGQLTNNDLTLPSRLHRALSNPSSDSAERRKLSDAFLKQLFEPLRPHLKGVKRLFVVPTGALAGVPLEALTSAYSISYVPSGSVLARTVENRRALDGSSLLVLGDPVFDLTPPAEPPASGVLLTSVLPGSNAAKAGLQAGDVLLSVGSVGVDSFDEVTEALKEAPAAITYWREGQRLKGRLAGVPLGATLDKRSTRAAVRAWRKDQESVSTRGTGHRRLPGTRIESEAIASLVKGSTLLLGAQASEQKLDELRQKGELKRYRLLHFATHGEMVENIPGRSALILAQDKLPNALEQSKNQQHVYDGRLTVSRIRTTWTLDADLVVLSACETGLGQQARGDGLLGFSQAFLARGARSVVLSRWKVDDVATALLMRRFYENLLGKRDDLKKPMGRAAALQEAKDWLRKLTAKEAQKAIESLPRGKLTDAPKTQAKSYEHPYYWAAFTLIGDPD
jgi:CHAT domain-containing protein/Tfp pilus assembly protein PilF